MTSVAFHVDQLFSPVPGGIGTYVRELVPAMARLDPGLEIRLLHARFGRPPPEEWMAAFPTTELRGSIRALYPGWALLGLPRLPGPARADVLHAPTPAGFPPPLPGQRLVVTVHDLAFLVRPDLFPARWRALFRLGLRRAARDAAALIVPSEHTAGDLARAEPAAHDRVRVIPLAASLPDSAIDVDAELERMGIPRPYVLSVGTLEPRKNLPLLVRAYRRAVEAAGLPHALVLAGPRGWGLDDLDRELAAPGPGRIATTGGVSGGRLDVLYRGADAFVYSSLYEGFGLPVLEAMARGVPTVASSASSLPEVAGDAALLVAPTSEAELAAALERVLADRRLAGRLSRAGRERASGFTWERTAELTLDVYREVLGRSGDRSASG